MKRVKQKPSTNDMILDALGVDLDRIKRCLVALGWSDSDIRMLASVCGNAFYWAYYNNVQAGNAHSRNYTETAGSGDKIPLIDDK